MALLKEYVTSYGNKVDYWKVISLSSNWVQKEATITVAGYVSAEAKTEGKMFLEKRLYDVLPTEFDNVFSIQALETKNPVAQCYEFIKSDTEDTFFSDAIDV